MSELVVIGFGDEKKAFEMRAVLQKLQKENHIDMEDVVVVTKGDKGKLRIHKSDSFTTAADVVRTYLETLLGSCSCTHFLLVTRDQTPPAPQENCRRLGLMKNS